MSTADRPTDAAGADIATPADGSVPAPVPGDHGTHGDPGYHGDKSAYLRRLKLIEGQVRGIHRMVDEDVYCIDIMTQVSAATRALENVAVALVSDHLEHCVAAAAAEGGEVAKEKLHEATAAIARLVKS